MDFFEYQTPFDCYAADGQTKGHKGAAWLELFTRSARRQLPAEIVDRYILKADAECRWMEDGRLSYSLSGERLSLVQQTRLDIDCTLLSLPAPQFVGRFPHSEGFKVGTARLEALFATEMLVAGGRGLGI